MVDTTENCLYHQDKTEFVLIQRDLQKWVPQKFIHRLAMAVCCCRRHIREKPFQADRDRLQTVKMFLYNLLNKDPGTHQCPDHLKQYILRRLERVHETDYSSCKFLDILYQARHGCFTALYRESKNSDVIEENKSGSREGNHIVKKKKMTKTQIECMLRKRRRRMDMQVLKLLMFPGNFPKLESECKLAEISRQNNCFVETHHNLNNKSFENNKNVTYIKVWTHKGENLEQISKLLASKAEDIQKKLDDFRKKRKEDRRKYNNYKSWRAHLDNPWDKDDIVLQVQRKENMFEDYDLKSWKSKTKATKTPSSVLNKGHCLYCHKDFTSLKDKTICKHHSGFIVNQTWNCCEQPISSTRIMKTPIYQDHITTGCVEAPTHVWRVHNRSDHKERKARASTVNIDIE